MYVIRRVPKDTVEFQKRCGLKIIRIFAKNARKLRLRIENCH